MDAPAHACHVPAMVAPHVASPPGVRPRGAVRPLRPAAAVVALLSAGSGRTAAAPHAPVWEVSALRYATIPGFPVRYLVAGADTSRKLDIAMTLWLMKGPGGRRVLMDAGFYRQKFLDEWKPAN